MVNASTRFIVLVLGGALLAACADDDDDKMPVSDVKIDGARTDDGDGKADSWRFPRNGGRIRVGAATPGQLTLANGWIGYEIELTAGLVDLDVTGTDDTDGQLDTILIVYGPRRANGTYPNAPIAFNDDEVAGTDLGSRIQLDAPADGMYRLVVSSYDNWYEWPTNVTVAPFRLTATCPRDGFGACGPAVSDVGGACWVDEECVGGSHCEGEITCAPGTACLWVREGACVEDYEWLTLLPRQCGGNPWQLDPAPFDPDDPGFPTSELAAIDAYYEAEGIDLMSLGLIASELEAVCAGCACPRGDRLVVRARPDDAARLADAHGFEQVEDAIATAWLRYRPIQCGGNPWDDETSRDPMVEAAAVKAWAADSDAPLGSAGFVYETEIQVVCRACSCPRGDTLVVTPKSPAEETAVRGLGFADLYLP
jgi:hypothetical protein